MAQSKKQWLKSIRRRCAQQSRALAYTAYRRGDVSLLDTYGELRRDIQETLHQLRRPPSVELRNITSPVTYQQVDQLRGRLETLQMRLISLQESQQ